MAVLVEGISVVVRRDAIDAGYPGGWPAFVENAPNATLCTDRELARIGFLDPRAVETFVAALTAHGLVFVDAGCCVDMVVVDQQRGPTVRCEWLEFSALSVAGGGKVHACWLYEDRRVGHGVHFCESARRLVAPAGWEYEGSLSQQFTFVPTGSSPGDLDH